MQLTKSSSKAFEYIDGNWYIIDLNNGDFLKRKYCMTWLCKHPAYRLSKEQATKIENSNICKPLSNVNPFLLGGITVFVGTILRVTNISFDLLFDYPIYVNIVIAICNYSLLIMVARILAKKDKRTLVLLINDEAEWSNYVSLVFPTAVSKLKYLLLMVFTQLLLLALMFLGMLLFFMSQAVIFLLLSDIVLFFSLMVTIRQPKNFTYHME